MKHIIKKKLSLLIVIFYTLVSILPLQALESHQNTYQGQEIISSMPTDSSTSSAIKITLKGKEVTQVDINIEGEITLEAEVSIGEVTTSSAIVWRGNNNNILIDNGKIKGLKVGEAEVTAETTVDNQIIMAICKVVIKPVEYAPKVQTMSFYGGTEKVTQFNKELKINGYQEGILLQLDENGDITGSTGFDVAKGMVTDYVLYVSDKIDILQFHALIIVPKVGQSLFEIKVDGIEVMNESDLQTGFAIGANKNSPIIFLRKPKIKIEVYAYDPKDINKTTPKVYTITVNKVQRATINSVELPVGNKFVSPFNPDGNGAMIIADPNIEELTFTVKTKSNVKLYKDEVSEENLIEPNDEGIYKIISKVPNEDIKLIAYEKGDGEVEFKKPYIFIIRQKVKGVKVLDEVVEFKEINVNYDTPEDRLRILERPLLGYAGWSWFVPLGNFGGYVTFKYDEPIINDPNSPYGIDFLIYGNGHGGESFAEPGNVLVSEDGQTWYSLAGSLHYENVTKWHEPVTYEDGTTGEAVLLARTGENGITGTPPYPKFGYADVALSSTRQYADPEQVSDKAWNPYSSRGLGDPFDLAWAVDSEGRPVKIDKVHYVKIQTATDIVHSQFGVKSTEVCTMVKTEPKEQAVGKSDDLKVLEIDGKSILGNKVYSENNGLLNYYEVHLNNPIQDKMNVNIVGSGKANISINNSLFKEKANVTLLLKQDGMTMFRVICQNGESEPIIYVVKCLGGGNPAINADIESIEFSPGSMIPVDNHDGSYTLKINENIDKLAVKVKSFNPKSQIKIDDISLEHGLFSKPFSVYKDESRYIITITSQDGSMVKEYPVIIRKESSGGQPDVEKVINVSFSLRGDALHGSSGQHLPKYWINKTLVEVPTGSTVKYLTDMMLYNARIDFDDTNGTYIAEINGLGEFDNGENSGWMYRHNGYIANEGYAVRTLKNGDSIEWFYTDDYTKEKDYEGGNWDGSSSGPNPQETEDGMILKPEVSLDEKGNAKIEISEEQIKNLMEQVVHAMHKGKALSEIKITLDAISLQIPKQISIILPSELFKEMESHGIKDMDIQTNRLGLQLDEKFIKEINQKYSEEKLKIVIENGEAIVLKMSTGKHVIKELENADIEVSIPYKLSAAEEVNKLLIYVIEEDRLLHVIKNGVYDSNLETLTFKTNLINTFAIGYEQFKDISNHWAYESIHTVTRRGLFKGVTEVSFEPDKDMSRAMFVTVLYRIGADRILEEDKILEEHGFLDVLPGEWYTEAVAWAVKNGISKGINQNTFSPNEAMTREQMAVMLVRFVQSEKLIISSSLPPLKKFEDEGRTSYWAKEEVTFMQKMGLMEGKYDNTFDPKGKVTRAEVAAMIDRILQCN